MLLPYEEVDASGWIVLLPPSLWVTRVCTVRKALDVVVSIKARSFGVSDPFKMQTVGLTGSIWDVLLLKSQNREVVTGIFQAEVEVSDVVHKFGIKAFFRL